MAPGHAQYYSGACFTCCSLTQDVAQQLQKEELAQAFPSLGRNPHGWLHRKIDNFTENKNDSTKVTAAVIKSKISVAIDQHVEADFKLPQTVVQNNACAKSSFHCWIVKLSDPPKKTENSGRSMQLLNKRWNPRWIFFSHSNMLCHCIVISEHRFASFFSVSPWLREQTWSSRQWTPGTVSCVGEFALWSWRPRISETCGCREDSFWECQFLFLYLSAPHQPPRFVTLLFHLHTAHAAFWCSVSRDG